MVTLTSFTLAVFVGSLVFANPIAALPENTDSEHAALLKYLTETHPEDVVFNPVAGMPTLEELNITVADFFDPEFRAQHGLPDPRNKSPSPEQQQWQRQQKVRSLIEKRFNLVCFDYSKVTHIDGTYACRDYLNSLGTVRGATGAEVPINFFELPTLVLEAITPDLPLSTRSLEPCPSLLDGAPKDFSTAHVRPSGGARHNADFIKRFTKQEAHQRDAHRRKVPSTADATAFLIVTVSGEELHFPGEACHTIQSAHSGTNARWLRHPADSERLLLLKNNSETLRIFHWKDLTRETPEQGVSIVLLPELASTLVALTNDWHYRPGSSTLVQIVSLLRSTSSAAAITTASTKTGFLTLDLSQPDDSNKTPTMTTTTTTNSAGMQCVTRRLAFDVKSVLGVYRSSLYFLNGRGWVCSISLQNLATSRSYMRHFFISSVWQTGSSAVLMARVVSKTTVAMAYRDEVVVLQGLLPFWL
ncbi:hypothetical protein P885DRAFT_64419 [Corynascus similis CBS 632.67]